MGVNIENQVNLKNKVLPPCWTTGVGVITVVSISGGVSGTLALMLTRCYLGQNFNDFSITANSNLYAFYTVASLYILRY